MGDEAADLGGGLILADLSMELDQYRPETPDGCAACRACALWKLRRWDSVQRTME